VAGPVSKFEDGASPHGVEIAPGVRVGAAALRFAFARSSGPGGQNVNKLETKAELRVDIDALPISGRAKGRLRTAAGDRIVGAETYAGEDGRTHTRGGELILTAQEHRSQSQNKSACLEKLRELLVRAMAEPKVRRKTKPSRGSIERRIEGKKHRGEIKRGRGGDGGGHH
jgi:ribosome-associated protein